MLGCPSRLVGWTAGETSCGVRLLGWLGPLLGRLLRCMESSLILSRLLRSLLLNRLLRSLLGTMVLNRL